MKKIELIFEEKFISKTEEERKNNFIEIYNKLNENSSFEQNLRKNL